MMFQLVEPNDNLARIRVVGVGGAGGNAVNRMVEAGLTGVDFIAANTDLQALRLSRADQVLQIGVQTTRGLGSGGNPVQGRLAVDEDLDLIRDALLGSDMVFVTAGMGGGTGTGGAPTVARMARELGALTVGIVTKPFIFEGRVRKEQAEAGIAEMREAVDTLIVIPNQRLLDVVPANTSMNDAFRCADNVLYEATRGIHDIIMKPHQVNLDFADVRSVMQGMGVALMGTGAASGENRAEEATRRAISSPLLEDVDIRGARGVLVNLSGGEVGLMETNTVMTIVQESAGDQAHIIFGYGVDESLGDTLQVTVIATGFDRERIVQRPVIQAAAPVPAPEPVAEPVMETVAEPIAEALPEEDAAPVTAEEPVLMEMVAVAGAEVARVRPAPSAEAAMPGLGRFTMIEPHPDASIRPEGFSVVGERPSAAVEEHHARAAAQTVRREVTAQVFLSDALMRDLSEPAYTRKYMD